VRALFLTAPDSPAERDHNPSTPNEVPNGVCNCEANNIEKDGAVTAPAAAAGGGYTNPPPWPSPKPRQGATSVRTYEAPPPPALTLGGRLFSPGAAANVGPLTCSTGSGCFLRRRRGGRIMADAAGALIPCSHSSGRERVELRQCYTGTAVHPCGATSGNKNMGGGQTQGVNGGATSVAKRGEETQQDEAGKTIFGRQERRSLDGGGSLVHGGGCDTRNDAPVELQNQSHAMNRFQSASVPILSAVPHKRRTTRPVSRALCLSVPVARKSPLGCHDALAAATTKLSSGRRMGPAAPRLSNHLSGSWQLPDPRAGDAAGQTKTRYVRVGPLSCPTMRVAHGNGGRSPAL